MARGAEKPAGEAQQVEKKSRFPSRAHGIPPMPDLVEERVELILDRMLAVDWPPGTSAKWARVWGLSKSTVEGYAAEASHLVTLSCKRDLDTLRSELIGNLHHIAHAALSAPKYKDYKAAVQAMAVIGDLMGLKRQQQEERPDPPDLVLTDELPTEDE